jgi:hypothetical protein
MPAILPGDTKEGSPDLPPLQAAIVVQLPPPARMPFSALANSMVSQTTGQHKLHIGGSTSGVKPSGTERGWDIMRQCPLGGGKLIFMRGQDYSTVAVENPGSRISALVSACEEKPRPSDKNRDNERQRTQNL